MKAILKPENTVTTTTEEATVCSRVVQCFDIGRGPMREELCY